jgi:hypothetical protein
MTIHDCTHLGGSLPEPELPVSTSVETLVWSLIDGTIDEPQLQQLDMLLADDACARQSYLDCMLMHAALTECFNSDTRTASASQPHQ